jgi:hypothetical protein
MGFTAAITNAAAPAGGWREATTGRASVEIDGKRVPLTSSQILEQPPESRPPAEPLRRTRRRGVRRN